MTNGFITPAGNVRHANQEVTLPSSRKIVYVVISLLTVSVVAFTFIGLTTYFNSRRHQKGFDQIKIGDSKESVIAVMGAPDTVEICRTVSSPNDTVEDKNYQEHCAEQYKYNSPLQPYVVSFDKNNRVLAKGYQVSP